MRALPSHPPGYAGEYITFVLCVCVWCRYGIIWNMFHLKMIDCLVFTNEKSMSQPLVKICAMLRKNESLNVILAHKIIYKYNRIE